MPADRGQIVLGCEALEPMLRVFVDQLGFRVLRISPAEAPTRAVVVGHGLTLALEQGAPVRPAVLQIPCDAPDDRATVVAPDGTQVLWVARHRALVVPELKPSLQVSRPAAAWTAGRAGMQYRDLLPDRQGGRFVASHIRIEQAGPVPDYVHHHQVRFQIIFCHAGWVRLVYEDQGAPFVMEAGQCVLQPPGIRHRVLESGAGLEVVEVGCPAEHDTWGDLELELPTTELRPERTWDGQRFVWGRAAGGCPWDQPGFVERELGVAEASGGVGRVSLVTTDGAVDPTPRVHADELRLWFVRRGAATLQVDGRSLISLDPAAAVAIPSARLHAVTAPTADFELLQVSVPGSGVATG